MRNVGAYYLWPAIWVGKSAESAGGLIDLSVAEDEMYRRSLTSGVVAKVLREGMFMFDFSS